MDAGVTQASADEGSEVFLHDGSTSGPLGDSKAGAGRAFAGFCSSVRPSVRVVPLDRLATAAMGEALMG